MYSREIAAPDERFVFSAASNTVPVCPGTSCQSFGSSIENVLAKVMGSKFFEFAIRPYH